mmetsp:Transcript_37684/g.95244  ORF Transcript_37684/g.95244 Transcript_37684/m.95244 type:complete len:338 (+) Transcript_37684:1390-2403(+)
MPSRHLQTPRYRARCLSILVISEQAHTRASLISASQHHRQTTHGGCPMTMPLPGTLASPKPALCPPELPSPIPGRLAYSPLSPCPPSAARWLSLLLGAHPQPPDCCKELRAVSRGEEQQQGPRQCHPPPGPVLVGGQVEVARKGGCQRGVDACQQGGNEQQRRRARRVRRHCVVARPARRDADALVVAVRAAAALLAPPDLDVGLRPPQLCLVGLGRRGGGGLRLRARLLHRTVNVGLRASHAAHHAAHLRIHLASHVRHLAVHEAHLPFHQPIHGRHVSSHVPKKVIPGPCCCHNPAAQGCSVKGVGECWKAAKDRCLLQLPVAWPRHAEAATRWS